jgi:hypothetical protein
VGASRRPVHVPAPARAGRHQLARGAGDPLRGHPPEGLGWQPDLGRGAGAVGSDVGVADVLAAGAFGPGLPQSTPAGHTGGSGLAPVTYRAALRLEAQAGWGPPPLWDPLPRTPPCRQPLPATPP